ncbi:MAG TPA: prepilin peptidase [Solirubrobacteraceae bacterium]|nr:prepilin peptidase [Solirubrobacteraceae bacterium]
MPVPVFAAAGLLGLVVGSFLNVVAHRLPLRASLVRPRSACPQCAAPVRPYDNVPVLSWLLLRGRCRDCGTRISPRYPLVEAGTAALWLAVAAVHHADTTQLVLGLVLVTFLVPLALIDLDHKILPNRITGPAALVGLGLGLALDPAGEPERLLAAAIAGGSVGLIALLMPSGMGMGDAKLLGVLGLYLGAGVAPAVLVALVSGTLVGVLIIARIGLSAGRKTAVPFGVFLALGGVVAVLAGDPLLDWYLTLG